MEELPCTGSYPEMQPLKVLTPDLIERIVRLSIKNLKGFGIIGRLVLMPGRNPFWIGRWGTEAPRPRQNHLKGAVRNANKYRVGCAIQHTIFDDGIRREIESQQYCDHHHEDCHDENPFEQTKIISKHEFAFALRARSITLSLLAGGANCHHSKGELFGLEGAN